MIDFSEETKKAYKETYIIIENSTDEVKNKIPNNFLKFLKKYMSNNYEPNIDYNFPLLKQNLMDETVVIMAVIYRNFICDKEERKKLIEKEKDELRKIEEEKRKKYNPDNIFKKSKANDEIKGKNETENLPVDLRKSNFFRRIINYIKSLFKLK